MTEQKNRERFIPHSKSEIVKMLCDKGDLSVDEINRFNSFCRALESLYHYEFHKKLQVLIDSYHPFNSDSDTRNAKCYTPKELREHEFALIENFRKVLDHANYEEIGKEDIDHALGEESLFKVSLEVDFDAFEEAILYWRGCKEEKITIKKWFKKKEITVSTFERVVILIKFKVSPNEKSDNHSGIMVKLFRNIPRADLEMLFPGTKVRMRLLDRIKIGITSAIGVVVLASKGVALFAALPLIWFLFVTYVTGDGVKTVNPQQVALLVAGGSAFGALLGYALRLWGKYKNQKMMYAKTLAENLYFKNLDNNLGVFFHLINAAEEEECKEAILGYYFLLLEKEGITAHELDQKIEDWIESKHGTCIDFEIKDSLNKLTRLNLIQTSQKDGETIYQSVSLDDAYEEINVIWDSLV